MRASSDKFWGSVNVLRAPGPRLAAGCSATLYASIAGIEPAPPSAGLAVMNGAQAAVMQLGRSVALELAPRRTSTVWVLPQALTSAAP